MDALTFATLVGLLSDFVSHRSAAERATLEEFVTWLSERRHEDLAALLRTTSTAAIGTKALLNETRDVLLSRLAAIDEALVKFASSVTGFATLATAVAPTAVLSDQAVDILRQIEAAGASKVLELHYGYEGTTTLVYLDAPGKPAVSIPDPRFLDDDLNTLLALGLLRPDRNSSGGRFFHYTRAAALLVRASSS
jgi:hypothetical protein